MEVDEPKEITIARAVACFPESLTAGQLRMRVKRRTIRFRRKGSRIFLCYEDVKRLAGADVDWSGAPVH